MPSLSTHDIMTDKVQPLELKGKFYSLNQHLSGQSPLFGTCQYVGQHGGKS